MYWKSCLTKLLLKIIAICIVSAFLIVPTQSLADESQNPFEAGYERALMPDGEVDYFVITINGFPVIALLHKENFADLETRARNVQGLLQQGLNDLYKASRVQDDFAGVKQVDFGGWPNLKLGNATFIRTTDGDAVEFSRLDWYPHSRKIDKPYLASYWKVCVHDVLLLLNGQEPDQLIKYPEAAVLGEIYDDWQGIKPSSGNFSTEECVRAVELLLTEDRLEKINDLILHVPDGFLVPETLPPVVVRTNKPVIMDEPQKSPQTERVDNGGEKKDFGSFILLIFFLAFAVWLVVWLKKPGVVQIIVYDKDDKSGFSLNPDDHVLRVNNQKVSYTYQREVKIPIEDLWKFFLESREIYKSDANLAYQLLKDAEPDYLLIRTSIKDSVSTQNFAIIDLKATLKIEFTFKTIYNNISKHGKIELTIKDHNWAKVKQQYVSR